MPSKIRVLDEHTINKIAAGEVIESPASVVKELVENSIDAGATEITVEITGGGRQLIRVSDNGSGMNRDDALLCLERHATSKLRSVEEIFDLHTMGFRGEAIPSIAAISKFTLLTACSAEEGTLLLVEGGKILQCAAAVRSIGTTIEVKSLFFNVPVRKKFQKSPAYDANEILKIMSLLALGNPSLVFKLISNGQTMLSALNAEGSLPEQRLKKRLSDVLGNEFVSGLCPVNEKSGNIHLGGMTGFPNNTRHNRAAQYLFVNQRPIFSPLAAYAVRDGYGTSLSTGRHPVYVLYLEVPGDLVDVNVHPQKREVRFRQEALLRDLITKGISHALQKHPSCYSVPASPIVSSHFFERPFESVQLSNEKDWRFQERVCTKTFPLVETTFNDPLPFDLPLPEKSAPPKVLATIPGYILLEGTTLGEFFSGKFSQKGIVLIDQKAAYTRVVFEKLQRKSASSQPAAIQSLLIPHSIELSKVDADLLRDHIEGFNKRGIQIREIGPCSFTVDSIPQIFGNIDIQALMDYLVEDLRQMNDGKKGEEEVEKRMAHSAVRAAAAYQGRLTILEAQTLINQLVICSAPYHCPAGKSIVAAIEPEELAKQFQKW